jgi:hypothetical protein
MQRKSALEQHFLYHALKPDPHQLRPGSAMKFFC